MKRLFDSGLFLAILTAVLFCWSTAQYNGFLHAANLDSDLMERSFHQVIYSGLVLSFRYIFLGLVIISLIFLLYSHLVLPSYISWLRNSVRAKRKIVRFRKFWVGNYEDTAFEKRAKRQFTTFAVLLVFSSIFIVSLAYFEKRGMKSAQDLIERYSKEADHRYDLISTKVGGEDKELLFLACGLRNCAGLTPGEHRVYYFDQSNGYSFIYEPAGER